MWRNDDHYYYLIDHLLKYVILQIRIVYVIDKERAV